MNDKENDNSIIPFEWAIKDITQPTLKEIGLDLRDGYSGLKRIIGNAVKKSNNDQIANNRVMIEALKSGSFVDSDIGVEYFGGILASSKSIDGKDDSSIYYLDIIKSLSSAQLHLHYVVYKSLNNFLSGDVANKSLNVGHSKDLSKIKLYISSKELEKMGLKLDTDLEALYRKGLLYQYEYNNHPLEGAKVFPYIMISPTALGIQLFAIANNKLSKWRSFSMIDFGNFPDIGIPIIFDSSLDNINKKLNNKYGEQ